MAEALFSFVSTPEVAASLVAAASSVVIAFTAAIFSDRWKRLQERRLEQEHEVQLKRIEQENAFHRESHNLRLFEVLATPNPSLQLATASILVDRLGKLQESEGVAPDRTTIIRALFSLTKSRDASRSEKDGFLSSDTASDEVVKFIADNVIPLVGARLFGQPEVRGRSPLADFDLQGVNFPECYLPDLDARGVDFWRSNFSGSGLRRGSFAGAILLEANLINCVFDGGDFRNTDMRRARLNGASFRNCQFDLDTVRMEGACIDSNTWLPQEVLDRFGLVLKSASSDV